MSNQRAKKLKRAMDVVSSSFKRNKESLFTVLLFLVLFIALTPDSATSQQIRDSYTIVKSSECNQDIVVTEAVIKPKPKLDYKVDLSKKQVDNFKLIYQVAKANPNKHGVTFEKTLLKIAVQESDLGLDLVGDHHKGQCITKASLGVFQFQVRTVKHLAGMYPKQLGYLKSKSDWWIADKLIKDNSFSAKLASYNIKRLSEDKLRANNYVKIVSGWNGGVVNKPYYNNVQRHCKKVSGTILVLQKMGALKQS